MKIEIWSDIACPFCYIGKAHLEKALSNFEHTAEVEVCYYSYQLDPEYHYQEGDTAFSVLTHKKQMPLEQVRQMADHIEQMAREAGLSMNIEKTLPSNTYDAHRLLHLAKSDRKEKQIMDALFKAYFTDGKLIEDKKVIGKIGVDCGLAQASVDKLLSSDEFAYEVKQDILESRSIGVSGVPFFVLNRKYAISGAQPVEVFTNALKNSFNEWKKDNPQFINLNSSDKDAACGTDGCAI